MTYNIIATGSRGNAVLINDSILIDCGIPWKKLITYEDKIRLVLLTHKHGDHFTPSTVKTLHKRHPAIRWGCCEWMVGPLLEAGVDKRVVDVFFLEKHTIYFGLANVMPVPLVHDVPNCGYRVFFPVVACDSCHTIGKVESLFYATDCATLDGVEVKDCDLYMIEANHNREEIGARISEKRASGEYSYEVYARRNHLSQEQALDWLAANSGPHSKYVFLHQHQERQNNAK